MIILDGKKVAAEIKEELKQSTEAFIETYGKRPCLAVVQVGDNPASTVYVNNKIKSCQEIGFISKSFHYLNILQKHRLEGFLHK